MLQGWIKLHRKLSDKSFFKKDSEKVHLWILLLLKANFTEKEECLGGKPFLCKPGQFTTGRRQLAEESGISESKIERILTYFEKIEQQIEQRKTSSNRLIIIVNWHLYQNNEQQIEQRPNNDRTTTEQRPNTLQESNILIKNKYITTLVHFDIFLKIWNENAGCLPKIKSLSEGRRRKLDARIKNNKNFQTDFETCCKKIQQLPFYLGKNDRKWQIDFDWLIDNDTKYLKILEKNILCFERNLNNVGMPKRKEEPPPITLQELEEYENNE